MRVMIDEFKRENSYTNKQFLSELFEGKKVKLSLSMKFARMIQLASKAFEKETASVEG
jgi:hypothetical protein